MTPPPIDNPEGHAGGGALRGWRGVAIRARRAIARTRRPALSIAVRRSPLSDCWGYDRGTPVDRYYIRRFLERHRADIRGDTLEVMDTHYSQRLGTDVLTRSVVDIDPTNPRATIVADLGVADSLPESRFDCFVATQTLQLVPDIREAIRNGWRCLRPGGVMLATLPVVSRLHGSIDDEGDFWRTTPAAATLLFGEVFGRDAVTIDAYGNHRTCIAFLSGMAHEELARRDLETVDPRFPLLVGVRAVRNE